MDLFNLVANLTLSDEEFNEKLDNINDDVSNFGTSFQNSLSTLDKGLSTMTTAIGAVSAALVLNSATQEENIEDVNKMEAAYIGAGNSVENGTELFTAFYKLLGETDQAIEATNQLATIAETQEEVAAWTEISAGIMSVFQDSMPLETLTESVAQTSELGVVTGVLADAINRAGITEDDFNAQLAELSTQEERADLITQTLNDSYSETGALYEELNSDVLAQREAELQLQTTMMDLAEATTPIITYFTELINLVLPQLVSLFSENTEIILAVAAVIVGLTAIVKSFIIVQQLATAVQWLFAAATNATVWPILLVVAAVVALIAIIATLYNNNEEFRVFFEECWNAISSFFTAAWDFMATYFKIAWDIIVAYFKFVWDVIIAYFTVVFTVLKTIVTAIADFFIALGQTIYNTFVGISSWFSSVFTSAANGIKSAFSTIASFFTSIWSSIQSTFSSVANWFSSVFSVASNSIKSAFSSISSFFNDVWTGIQNAFSNVASWFSSIFSNAWNAVKSVFSSGGSIFSGITDGIYNVFKTVVNALISGINTVVAIPFKAINTALSGLRSIEILGVKPFSWLSNISIPSIPYLAKGGILDSPTLSMIGEAGEEAVIPLENNTTGIQKIADLISANMTNKGVTVVQNIQTVSQTAAQLQQQAVSNFQRLEWA